MLESQQETISPRHQLHVVDIKEINGETKKLIDSLLVSICEGESDSELKLVKLRLHEFLKDKTEDTKMGAVAEFLVHVYLNKLNYKQEFLFFNLEENSIKKGFDGLFSKDSKTYLVESKSGSISSKDSNHQNKLKLAYADLKKYVAGESGKGKNNPWKNAFNHASHCDVATEKSIRKKIKNLRDMYDSGKYTEVKNYNIITCSTIYLNSVWDDSENRKILNENWFLCNFEGVSVNAICITKASLKNFLKYLGE